MRKEKKRRCNKVYRFSFIGLSFLFLLLLNFGFVSASELFEEPSSFGVIAIVFFIMCIIFYLFMMKINKRNILGKRKVLKKKY
jgi:hypothetical protein